MQPARLYNGGMFFFTYLGKELRRRLRQAVFIALGLAVGVGLVVTVTAASAGIKNAQTDELKGLYGIGTDITVTGQAPSEQAPSGGKPASGNGEQFQLGPNGGEVCVNNKCHSLKQGYTIDNLGDSSYSPISDKSVAEVAALHDVSAAAGGLTLTDMRTTISSNSSSTSFTVDGTDISYPKLGPLGDAVLTSGRTFTQADSDKNVALVDKNYATANDLKAGGTITVGGVKFSIIGIVTQAQGASPPDVYIPLARAQALGKAGPTGSLSGDVNTIYVTAAMATDITAVSNEIAKVLPKATITTPSSLANEVTGSVTTAAKLVNDLGKWLLILVLIAAFAVAVLLTMAAVSRRVSEFGTLKALGWRGRRIIAQVMGESLAIGLLGAAAGVGLGFAGAAIINAIAPKLYAILTQSTGEHIVTPNGALNPTTTHTVPVPLTATVSAAALLAAVLLAMVGGLLAGSFGSWRIARLRPADAIAKVG
jgi:putative ABC transport system permease protein